MKLKTIKILSALTLTSIALSGCAGFNKDRNLNYSGLNYVPSNAVTAQDQHQAEQQARVQIKPHYNYFAAQGFAGSKDIKQAFEMYIKNKGGHNAATITGTGVVTQAFDPYVRTLVSCSPNQSAKIMLEAGEKITGIQIDNEDQWSVTQMETGTGANQSTMVIIKPSILGPVTDLTIGTNKRTYSIGLVSQKGYSPIVNFWYPLEIERNYQEQLEAAKHQKTALLQNTVSTSSAFDSLSQLNTNYQISVQGKQIVNKPENIYSDGKQTIFNWPALNSLNPQEMPIIKAEVLGEKHEIKSKYDAPYLYVSGVYNNMVVSFMGMPKSSLLIQNGGLS